jgi:hypothetical protein
MTNKDHAKLIALCMTIVVLLCAGCGKLTNVAQTPSADELAAAPDKPDLPSNSRITIGGITASDSEIRIHGKSNLPNGTCINTELWSDDMKLAWWPDGKCATINQGNWELTVLLVSEKLKPDVQYVVHAYQPGSQQNDVTLAFDISGPQMPPIER